MQNTFFKRAVALAPTITAIVCTIWICVYTYLHQYTFADDAFIFFRYVNNLVAGHGLVFNPGEKVEGFTSPLWVGILYLCALLNADLLHTAILLSMLFATGTILIILYVPFFTFSVFYRCAAALVLCLSNWFMFWITSGMETFLFTFLLLVTASIFNNEHQQNHRHYLSGTLCALTTLARPEGAILWAILVVFSKNKKSLLLTAIPLLFGYQIFRVIYFETFFPNTAMVKVDPGWSHLNAGVIYIRNFFISNPFAALAFVPAILFVQPQKRAIISQQQNIQHAMYTWLLIMLVYFIFVGGDFFENYRFFVPLYPWMVVLVFRGIHIIDKIFDDKIIGWMRYTALTALVTLLLAPSISSDLWHRQHGIDWIIASGKLGVVLNNEFSDDTYIAAPHIGALGYYSNLPLLDMLGLTDKHIAKKDINEKFYTQYKQRDVGHEKFDIDYAVSKQPDLFIPLHGFTRIPATHFSEVPLRLGMEHKLYARLSRGISYEVTNIEIERNFYWIVVQKKGTPLGPKNTHPKNKHQK